MNDQFFLDDDVVISFDDNMIEEIIPNVSVIEERFKEDSILRLNQDQIKAEVTNLVIDKYKNNALLKAKVANYTNLFFQFPQISKIRIQNIKPIIYADKLTYFNNADEHSQNKEYEKTNFQKSDKLGNFISQFHSLNRDMSKQSSILSSSKLYALYAPFATRDDNDTFSVLYKPDHDEDGLRHCFLEDFECDGSINDTVRLISKVDINKQTVYEGDFVNIIGFYNIVDKKNDLKIKVVDIQKYIDNVQALQEGDKVNLIFNEPLLNKSGDVLLKNTKGNIIHRTEDKIIIELNKDVMFKNEIISKLTYNIKTLSNPFTIYSNTVSETDVYTKQMLLNHNIVFKFPYKTSFSIEEVLHFISPSSIGEVLLVWEHFFKNIYNLSDLSYYILSQYGIKLDDISIELHSFIKYIFMHNKVVKPVLKRVRKNNVQFLPYYNTLLLTDFQKNNELLKYYNKVYPSYDTYVDDVVNRFRYLRTQNDKGAYYFINLIKKTIEKKYKKHYSQLTKFQKDLVSIEQALDKLELPSLSERNNCESTYAKSYKKLKDLLSDNEKNIFFDKKHDTTEYKLKEGFTGSTDKELKIYLLNELTSSKKYKGLSKDEIEFEVQSIIKGKREVQLGDLCILHTSTGDIVYVRKLIENKPMWIRKFKTPFKICTDPESPLIKYNDLVKLDTCIKQTFDDICRTNRNAKVLYKYRVLVSLKNEITSVLNLLEQFDKIQEILDNDIEYFKRYTQIIPNEHKPDRNFEYVEHVDYEDYNGDDANVGDVEYMIEFNEQNTFVVAPQSIQTTEKKQVLENQDVLNMFLSFLQLELDENEKEYILNGINSKYPRKNINITLQKYKEKFMNEVNKEAYKSSEKYMKMFDNLVKQKLDKIEIELTKKYYFNLFRNIISMIIVFIFIRYPNYVMKRVHPSCVKFLSYIGYPITDNKKDVEKSLVAYMSCILVNVSVAEDIRFALFYEKDSNEIQKVLKDTIDELLNENYELRMQLQLTKTIIESVKENNTSSSIKEYNNLTSFKPSFKFGNIERMSKKDKTVVRFIKTIQDIVSNSKIAKQNGLNVPNLSNACCNEQLIRDIDFFSFFESQQEFKNINKTVSAMKQVSFTDENLHPPQKHEERIDLFSKYTINHTNVVPMEKKVEEETEKTFKEHLLEFIQTNEFYKNNTLLTELSKNFENKDWWNDIFYPTILEDLQEFEKAVNSISDKINKEDFEYVKDVIINVNSSFEPSTVRHTLYMFLSTKIKVILGKILNKQKLTEKMLTEELIQTNPIYGIIASITNNKNFDSVISRLRNTLKLLDNLSQLYIETTNEEMIVKNISIFSFITFTMFKMLLINTLTNSKTDSIKEIIHLTSPVEKDNIRITSDIIGLLVSSLKTQLHNTIIDNDLLKMSVEALREKRKQELIDAYKVDDEERELQKQLKKLGLQNWADILTGEDDIVSEDVIASTKLTSIVKDEYEEEKDFVYSTYKGENADDDEVDEEYVSYESYDN